ncbi:MAG: AAA family ATPase [bacterium]
MNKNLNCSNNRIFEKFMNGNISIKELFEELSSLDNDNINNIINRKKTDCVQKNNNNIVNFYEYDREKLNEILNELESLVGLNHIKNIIKEYIAFIKVQKMRRNYNLKCFPIVMHMIFKGNPGTGKTTVARIIGKVFKEIGFLKNGNITEVDRGDLVGEYIGHTAQKTRKIINKSLGGVLFIDEAYSLARGGERDFGKEAIDTMVKSMEDHKEDLIIILAGYPDEMEYFLKSNPGLSSRFAIKLNFPDYKIDELIKIAEIMYKKREYILNKSSKYYIYKKLSEIRNNEQINGNARSVRNFVENSIRQHAKRIINNKKLTRSDLMYITKEDLIGEEFIND